MVQYAVSVFTGKKRGAGTDSNVFVEVFGDQGDTGERPLKESKSNINKFERGKVSVCVWMLNFVVVVDIVITRYNIQC